MKKYDGWVVIGADFDTTQFDKKMDQSKKNIEKFEQEVNDKQVEIDVQSSKVEATRKELEKLTKEYEDFKSQAEAEVGTFDVPDEVADQVIADTMKMYESSIPQINQELEEQQAILEKQKQKYADIVSKIEEENKKIEQTSAAMKDAQKNANQKQIIGAINNVNKGLDSAIRKVGRWALSVFGVVSAFSFVRQAMSTLSSYNEQLATDLEYIRFAIASTLLPVIQKIIELVYKLLSYIGYLAKAWFRVNIFANASTDAFNKNNKALASSVSNAKELNKQLASFDEMNVLKDTDVGGSAGGTGIGDFKIPGEDLSAINMDVPKWLKWLGKNGDLIKKILEAIAAAILAIKYNWGLLGAAAAFTIIDGIVNLVKDLKKYLDEPTWENFAKVGADIGQIVTGIGIALLKVNPLIGAIVIGVGQLITSLSALPDYIQNLIAFIEKPSWQNFVETLRSAFKTLGPIGEMLDFVAIKMGIYEESTLSVKDAQEELKKATEDLTTAQDEYTSAVDRAEEAQRLLEEAQRNTGLSGEELNKQVEQGILDYKDMTEEQREVYKAYLNNTKAQDNLKVSTDNLSKAKDNEKRKSLELKLATLQEGKQFDEYKQTVLDALESGEIKSDEARRYLKQAMQGMSSDSEQTFVKDIPDNIKSGLEPNKYKSTFEKFKSAWNGFLNGLTSKLGLDVRFGGGGGGTRAQGGIYYPQLLPKLAVGGIINQPGRGVPYHGATIGEHGAEAVIPLTDSQQMELLGATIGRYITVNAQMNNYMNGRIISRELQRINNESDFAFNR